MPIAFISPFTSNLPAPSNLTIVPDSNVSITPAEIVRGIGRMYGLSALVHVVDPEIVGWSITVSAFALTGIVRSETTDTNVRSFR